MWKQWMIYKMIETIKYINRNARMVQWISRLTASYQKNPNTCAKKKACKIHSIKINTTLLISENT